MRKLLVILFIKNLYAQNVFKYIHTFLLNSLLGKCIIFISLQDKNLYF